MFYCYKYIVTAFTTECSFTRTENIAPDVPRWFDDSPREESLECGSKGPVVACALRRTVHSVHGEKTNTVLIDDCSHGTHI